MHGLLGNAVKVGICNRHREYITYITHNRGRGNMRRRRAENGLLSNAVELMVCFWYE